MVNLLDGALATDTDSENTKSLLGAIKGDTSGSIFHSYRAGN